MTNQKIDGATWRRTMSGRYDFYFGPRNVLTLHTGETIDLGRDSVAWVMKLESYSSLVRAGSARVGEWAVTIRCVNTPYQVEAFATLREAKEAVERWVSGGVLTPSAWV